MLLRVVGALMCVGTLSGLVFASSSSAAGGDVSLTKANDANHDGVFTPPR